MAAFLLIVLYVLHQDVWFWHKVHPMVFGVLPIGLAYHVGFVLVTAGVLLWLVRTAWPAHLDDDTVTR